MTNQQNINRASSSELDTILGKTFPVQNLGHVRVIDYMGNDNAIVQMARVSYGEGTKTLNEDRGLIRYLMEHKHTSPFEGCVLKLHLKMPIFVARQWVRHRTAAMNEYSARYSEMRDEFYHPELSEIQLQSTSNKQGSEAGLDAENQQWFQSITKASSQLAMEDYKEALDKGVAREMARINMPLSAYTEFYWEMNLHNLLHFLRLRCDSHAQKQIRDYADVILNEVVKLWVPHTYEAFVDFVMEAVTLSRMELQFLKSLLDNNFGEDRAFLLSDLKKNNLSQRQAIAFSKKLGALLYDDTL